MKHLYTVILIIITTLNTYSQTLSSISTEATSSTTSNSFVDVTGAYVTLDVTGADKIFLIATFSSKTNSGNAVAEYRIADNSDNNINSSGMSMNHNGNSYIGSDIYIFDVSAETGNKTYTFQHKTTAQTLETTVSLTAILLYDGTYQLNNDFSTLSNTLALGDTWESILESNKVVLIDNGFGGGFYVSAMVETQKTSGGANNVVGEWKLQYKENTATTWTDLNSPVSRSATWTGVGIVNLVGAMPDNTPRGTYKFRIVHRKVSGASHVQSITRKLSVVSMATVGGFFPIFISSRPTSSTTNTSMTPIISNLVEPQDNTNMFFHAQYSLQSSGTSNAPMHDLFVSTSGGTLLDGSDYARYIQNNSDVGNGGITTALNNLIAGITYKIELRHKSTASRSLTTNNAFLVGFGMFKTEQSLILPVTVNSTQGFISGSYSNLKEAFDAINNGVYRGEIVIYINSDIEETATASINASGVGSANYTDILIFPTSSSLSISGNLNAPIIDLNGADNITIDGRVNAIGTDPSLTIINTNTGTSASTIRFINSAENNTVKCSYIEGANSSATGGIVLFSTSNIGTGNNNNTIENNTITNSGTRVRNAIYSLGSSGRRNSGNTLLNNNIYNVLNTTATSNAIYLDAFSDTWTISENNIYETTEFVPAGNYEYSAIKINTTDVNDFVISNNFIGGSDTSTTGTAWTTNSITEHRFVGININTTTTGTTSISNNTIKNFNFTGANSSPWDAIYIL